MTNEREERMSPEDLEGYRAELFGAEAPEFPVFKVYTEMLRARAAEDRLEMENEELKESWECQRQDIEKLTRQNAELREKMDAASLSYELMCDEARRLEGVIDALKKRVEELELQVKDAQAAYDIEQKMRIMDAKEYRNGK